MRLPAGSGFDPGGIGKGLAADIVSAELLAAGARGACVNLGGDLRVTGEAPGGGTWTVAVEHPGSAAADRAARARRRRRRHLDDAAAALAGRRRARATT